MSRSSFSLNVLQAQYVWFGNGCAGMLFEVVSADRLVSRRTSALTSSTLQGNNSDMGLHLYVPDEEDRGTNWDCTVEEMLRYSSGAESQQVLAPTFARLPSLIQIG